MLALRHQLFSIEQYKYSTKLISRSNINTAQKLPPVEVEHGITCVLLTELTWQVLIEGYLTSAKINATSSEG